MASTRHIPVPPAPVRAGEEYQFCFSANGKTSFVDVHVESCHRSLGTDGWTVAYYRLDNIRVTGVCTFLDIGSRVSVV